MSYVNGQQTKYQAHVVNVKREKKMRVMCLNCNHVCHCPGHGTIGDCPSCNDCKKCNHEGKNITKTGAFWKKIKNWLT